MPMSLSVSSTGLKRKKRTKKRRLLFFFLLGEDYFNVFYTTSKYVGTWYVLSMVAGHKCQLHVACLAKLAQIILP